MKYTMYHPGFDYTPALSKEETSVSLFANAIELRLPVGKDESPVFHFAFDPEQGTPDEPFEYTGISLNSEDIWDMELNGELRLDLRHAEEVLHSYFDEDADSEFRIVLKLYHNLFTGDYQFDVETPWADIPADIAREIMVAMTHGTLQIANSDLADSPIVLYPNTNLFLFGSARQVNFVETQTAKAKQG